MKIQIIGYSGSGKSTFATKLSKLHDVELTHLDKFYFLPNWVTRNEDEVLSKITDVIYKEDWIIDGNYKRFYGPLRLNQADQIFLFEFSRLRCFYQVIKRRLKYNKKVRPSSSEGCIEKLDLAFIKWIFKDGRTKATQQYYQDSKLRYKDKIIVFKRPGQVKKYIKSLMVK